MLSLVVAALAASAPPAGSRARPSPRPGELVQLTSGASTVAVRRGGGVLVSRSLNVWKVPRRSARKVVAQLRRSGDLQLAERDHALVPMGGVAYSDPLVAKEWWMHAVGFDRVQPPGPGVPATILDFGLDLTHPEFASRPNTISLNRQELESPDDYHGTAVSSVLAAPANGLGLVGIYPDAVLREWDFHDALLSDVIAGFDVASRTRGVINISGGFTPEREPLLERAVQRAFDRGSLVVASAGNDRTKGSPYLTPAYLPHVLTVAATNEANRVTYFSNRSRTVDLAAPGQDIPVAVPSVFTPSGYDVYDGTSFSSPLVAGAAAWVWTLHPQLDNTQLFDLMRFSSRDLAPAGRDANTGYGLLDLPRALTRAAPPPDVQEPNEDVYAVRPHGLSPAGNVPLTAPGHGAATLRARLDAYEDPVDVYRLWQPAKERIVVSVRGNHDVNLTLWGARTVSVAERGAALRRDRLGMSLRRGKRLDRVAPRLAPAHGSYVYAEVTPGHGTIAAVYSLNVATVRR